MLQPRGGADFTQETLTAECRAEVRMQHLDRYITIVLQIVREIHGSHAAGAELAVDAVAVGDCGGQAVHALRHCPRM